MLAFLKFDDEDTYYSPEDGLDDVSKWLSEIMTETGICGTLCVMGARADLLKERGREDVLEAMAKHEIVSHQMANVHPDLVTILSDKEWDDGVEAMREYEDRVAEIFRRAFGRDPQGLSQHNVQWGPQHAALAADLGVPRLSIPIGVPGTEQPCWYAGALNMPCHMYDLNQGPKLASSGTIEITPEFGIGDSLYSCDDEFEKRFAQLKEYVDACVDRGVEFIHLFGCHPSRILARGFLEGRCMASGENRSAEEVGFLYGTYDAEAEERAKKNFRRYCEFIRDHPDIECMGASEVAKAFSSQPNDITRDEMMAHAQEMVQKGRILLHRTFSPAELFVGMAESLVAAGEDKDLPNGVDRRNILGPVDIPIIGLELSSISHAELLTLCHKAVNHVRDTGHLPANIHLERGRLGIGQLAIVVAKAYAAQSRYDHYTKFNLDASVRYPDVAWNIDAWVRHIMHEHVRFDPNISSEKLAKHSRLQTWTLKPAWLSPPRGKACHEGRISLN